MGGETAGMAGQVLLTFASTHATMVAADHLADAGLPHRVIPRPVKLAGECGVAVVVPGEAGEAALAALAEADGGPVAIYDAEERQTWVKR